MKYIAVLLVGFILTACAHDDQTNALVGLMIGAVIVNAVIDDTQSHRRRYADHPGRHERWDDRGYGERDGRGGHHRRRDHEY